MAASTITRDAWVNDTGTALNPNEDGTVINNNVLQNHIYARIDAMFAGAGAYAIFTFGGRIAADGFGAHAFTAGGTGGNTLRVRNTTAGTGNYGSIELGNDGSASAGALYAFSSTYTTNVQFRQDSTLVESARVGGLGLSASHASGVIRLYTANVERTQIDAGGRWGIGGAASAQALFRLTGTFSPGSGSTGRGLIYDGTINGPVSQEVFGVEFSPTLMKAASGTHAIFASLGVNTPAIGAGASALSNAASLYVVGQPTGATNNYALFVNTGMSRFGGTVHIDDGQILNIGDIGNGHMSTGININQGVSDNELITAKSSDLGHGFSGITDTDAFLTIKKANGPLGGVEIAGFGGSPMSAQGIVLWGSTELADSSKATSSSGQVNVEGSLRSGTGRGAIGTNGNIIAFRDNGTTRFILDADGESHQDVGSSWITFDGEDDIAVLELLTAHVTQKHDPLRKHFGSWLRKSRKPLEQLGLVTFNRDGHHFLNASRLLMLLTGAARQNGARLARLERRLLALEAV